MQDYSLIVPFSTDNGFSISQTTFPFEFKVNSYLFVIKKLGETSYSLKVTPFKSESDAEQYFLKIKSALVWISLQRKVGVLFPKFLSKVKIYSEPIKIDKSSPMFKLGNEFINGDYDGNNAVIVCNQQNIVCYSGFSPTFRIGVNSNNIITTINEALNYQGSEKIFEDNELILAMDLYSNYFFENSKYSKFITLVNVLEALTPSHEKISQDDQKFVDEIKKHAKSMRNDHKKGSKEYVFLNKLINGVARLKEKSIKSSIQDFVENTLLIDSNFEQPENIRKKVGNAYDLRSKILHEGKIDQSTLNQQLQFLDSLVPHLLKTLYCQKLN